MTSWIRNQLAKLCNALSAPVGATRDTPAEILQIVRETDSLLCNRIMENMEYGRLRLKDIVEKETREEEKEEEQQQDDEQYDTVPNMKLVYEGKCLKEFRMT